MKAHGFRRLSIFLGTLLLAAVYGAQSVSAIIEFKSELPDSSTLNLIATEKLSTNTGTICEISTVPGQISTGYYFALTDITGYSKLSIELAKYEGGNRSMGSDAATINTPQNAHYLYVADVDDMQSIQVKFTDYVASGACSANLAVYAWTPNVPTKTVYVSGHENDAEPSTKPTYSLTWGNTPQTWIQQGSAFDISDCPVLLAEKWTYRTVYYDVSNYLTYLAPDTSVLGDQTVTFRTSYRTSYGGGRGLSLPLKLHIAAPGEEQTNDPQFPNGKGDVNNDGSVTVADAVMLLRYLLSGWQPSDATQFMNAADLSADSRINVKDLTALKHTLATM